MNPLNLDTTYGPASLEIDADYITYTGQWIYRARAALVEIPINNVIYRTATMELSNTGDDDNVRWKAFQFGIHRADYAKPTDIARKGVYEALHSALYDFVDSHDTPAWRKRLRNANRHQRIENHEHLARIHTAEASSLALELEP